MHALENYAVHWCILNAPVYSAFKMHQSSMLVQNSKGKRREIIAGGIRSPSIIKIQYDHSIVVVHISNPTLISVLGMEGYQTNSWLYFTPFQISFSRQKILQNSVYVMQMRVVYKLHTTQTYCGVLNKEKLVILWKHS
jgi:hypothetical protein